MDHVDRPARVVVDHDLMRDGVRIAVSPRPGTVILWGHATYRILDPDEPTTLDPDAYLHLHEDVARAMYEALGRYFGGDAVDARRLRQDYDAERARVDKFIDATLNRST